MEIGIIGLGKMGLNLASNLKDHGYRTKGLDLSEQARLAARREGIETYETISQMVASFTGKRVIWLMLPAGEITESVLKDLLPLVLPEDIVI